MTSTDSGFESTTASWLCGDGGGCGSLVSVLIEKKKLLLDVQAEMKLVELRLFASRQITPTNMPIAKLLTPQYAIQAHSATN